VRCEAVKALGIVAACGDEFARDAAERALEDGSRFVREAASMAVVKLTRTAEMVKQAREEEAMAKERRKDALATQRKLTNLLTGLIKNNTDLELARLKSFDLAWTVNAETGRGASWPQEKFERSRKEAGENGEEEEDEEEDEDEGGAGTINPQVRARAASAQPALFFFLALCIISMYLSKRIPLAPHRDLSPQHFSPSLSPSLSLSLPPSLPPSLPLRRGLHGLASFTRRIAPAMTRSRALRARPPTLVGKDQKTSCRATPQSARLRTWQRESRRCRQ